MVAAQLFMKQAKRLTQQVDGTTQVTMVNTQLQAQRLLLTFFSLTKEIPRHFQTIRVSPKAETESLMF